MKGANCGALPLSNIGLKEIEFVLTLQLTNLVVVVGGAVQLGPVAKEVVVLVAKCRLLFQLIKLERWTPLFRLSLINKM